MSLLRAVEESIKMCKAEESRLSETIRQSKELLRSMKTCVTDISEIEPAATKDDILPEEKQEIELLDKVLKKALKIRSTAHKEFWSAGDPNNHSKVKNKPAVNDAVKIEEKSKQVKSVSALNNYRVRSAGGSGTRGVMFTRPVRRGSAAHPVVTGKRSVLKSTPVKISTASQESCDLKSTNAEGLPEDQSTSMSCNTGCEDVSVSDRHKKSQTTEQWIQSPLLSGWRSQRAKQSRLWNKVLTHQSKPIPERTQFSERLRSTFPSERSSVSPADFRAELNVLAQRCLDLTHCFYAEFQSQQADQSHPAGSEPGVAAERCYESSLMLDGLERMTEELLTRADRQKRDWERWNKCHTKTLCPVRPRGEWDDPGSLSLPPVLSYVTENELRELEVRRLRVEKLKQAVKLHQAMSDILVSHWTCGINRPSAVVLRGLYSLLAEGGLQFPSLVLDSE